MLQEISCRPSTAEFRVRSQAIPCEICGGLNAFLRVLPFFPVSISPPILYSFICDRRYVYLAFDTVLNNALNNRTRELVTINNSVRH